MIFNPSKRISRYMETFLICLAMSVLFTVFVVVVLMNSSLQPISSETNDKDLIEEFRDLFAEFLRDPEQYHSSKHVRDTSRNDKKKQRHSLIQTQTAEDEERSPDRPDLRPLYPCNYFDGSSRSCINVRQLGTTLTIGVRVESKGRSKYPIHWYRFFKIRGEDEGKSLKFIKFSRGNLPWNINIGGENNELRISPITEIDFSYNFFLATLNEGSPEDVQKKSKKRLQLLKFSIEPISIDMGTLYHGEEITVNIRSFMELPGKSVRYEWATIGGDYGVKHNLPSNMKMSHDGSAIIIKEHSSEGDMVLTCAVFSNKDVNLGRRNFFLRKILLTKNPNVKIKSGASFRRKRRYLDYFYAQPYPAKPKRNSIVSNKNSDLETEGLSQSNQSSRLNYFPEVDNPPPTTSQFDLVDRPQEAVPNVYGNPSTLGNVVSQTEVLQISGDKQELKSNSVDDLIGEANEVVQQSQAEKSGQDYPANNRIVVEERLSAEDRESIMIADCKDDLDCGINAVCFKIERNRKFCRCKPHYKGNGLFCWSF